LNTANYVAIPLTPETLNLEGMLGLLGVIGQAQARANPHLKTAGIILNKLQPNWRSHKKQALGIRNWEQRENVFATEIKNNVSVVNSLDSQSLIVLDQPESEHARVYWYLLNDLLQVIGGPAQADVAEIVANMRKQDQENEKVKGRTT
jgi:cellulose biosynthesis protein BcsQ